MVEVLPAEGAYRHQPVGAGLVQGDEQTEAGDAGDAAGETGAYPVGEVKGDEAVHGVALALHRPAFGRRDVFADRGEVATAIIGEAALAEPERRYQRPVDDQIGIAADRRGEMGVTLERESEMADVAGTVDGPGLGSQDRLAEEIFMGGARRLGDNLGELAGLHPPAAGAGCPDPETLEKVAQGLHLGRVGLIVHPVHAWRLRVRKGDGGGDVGGDHAFLDQAVAVEPPAPLDGVDAAAGADDDAVLRQIEIKGAALLPRPVQGVIDPVKRCDGRGEQRGRQGMGGAVPGLLYLAVGEPRRRAHHGALESVLAAPAVPVDPQMHREARAVLTGSEGTKIVRQSLGQHRHHPVRQIDRVAALISALVQRVPRPDVMGDIGDGDDEVPAALIRRVRIGLRPYGVVEIPGVLIVDGDQRQLTQIGAIAKGRGLSAFGLIKRASGEFHRDALGMKGNEADRSGIVHVPQPFDHLGLARAEATAGKGLGAHQFPGPGAGRILRLDGQLRPRALVHGRNPALTPDDIIDTQDLAGRRPQAAYGDGLIGAIADGFQPRQHALSFARRRQTRAVGGEVDDRRSRVLGPLDGPGDDLAVDVGAGDLDDPDPRKDAGSGGAALGVRADQSVAFELLDHVPDLGAGRTGDRERPGDITFAHGTGAFPDQPKDIVFGRE